MKKNKLRGIILLGIASILIFTNCYDDSEIKFDVKTFNREWKAWEDQGIVDYSVNQKWDTFEIGINTQVIVKDNAVNQMISINHYGLIGEGRTISDIYIWINSVYEKYRDKGGPINITITYNNEYHYPEYVVIIPQKTLANGEGIRQTRIILSEFMPLMSLTEE